jgi:hypothetical protein
MHLVYLRAENLTIIDQYLTVAMPCAQEVLGLLAKLTVPASQDEKTAFLTALG